MRPCRTRSETVGAHDSSVLAVDGSRGAAASQHPSALETRGGDAGVVVRREPVVHLVRGAREATTVPGADDNLVVQRALEQEVLENVGCPEDCGDTWPRQNHAQPLVLTEQ
jgi:hypothetical protein